MPVDEQVTRFKVSPDDRFIVIATDGLWCVCAVAAWCSPFFTAPWLLAAARDVMTNEEVANHIYRMTDVQHIADALVHEVCLSACLHACLSVHLTVCCLTVCLFVCLCVCLCVCLSICLSACLSVCLSVCLPACLSVFMSVCFSVFLLVCLSAFCVC